jgi:predicted acyltransferase (DUF342 family)
MTAVGVLATLAIVVTATIVTTRSSARLLAMKTDSVRAFYLAEAGLAVGESEILREYEAKASWVTDVSVQGDNAHVVSAPLTSLQEMQPRLVALQVLVDVLDESGVYKVRSSATLSSHSGTTDAALVKYIVIKPGSEGEGGVSQHLLIALSRSILSGGDLILYNNARVEGSAHSNETVTLLNNVVITSGYTDGDDMVLTIPQMTSVADYAQVQADRVRSGYSGGWTSNPNNLVGNVHLPGNLTIGNNRTIHANLWVDGDLKVSNNSEVYGDLFVEGDLTLSNGVKVYGKLFVKGSLTIENNIQVDGPIYVYGDSGSLKFGNNAVVKSHIISSVDIDIHNNITVQGSLLSERNVSIHNNATLGTAQYGALVYAGGDVTIGNNVTIRIGSIIAHGEAGIRNNGRVLQSGLGVDPSIFELFPGVPRPAIVDSHWSR